MKPILGALVRCGASGGGLAALLALATARPWLTKGFGDPAAALALGRVIALALWLSVLVRLRFLASSRPERDGYRIAVATSAAVATLASLAGAALAVAGGLVVHGAALPWALDVWALLDGIVLAVLGATLLFTIRNERALVATFVAIAWVLPALLGPSAAVRAGISTGNGPEWPLRAFGPFAAAVGAAWAAMVVLRPRRAN